VGAGLVRGDAVAGLTARREPWGRVSAVG
jgi:hypothetical protein